MSFKNSIKIKNKNKKGNLGVTSLLYLTASRYDIMFSFIKFYKVL